MLDTSGVLSSCRSGLLLFAPALVWVDDAKMGAREESTDAKLYIYNHDGQLIKSHDLWASLGPNISEELRDLCVAGGRSPQQDYAFLVGKNHELPHSWMAFTIFALSLDTGEICHKFECVGFLKTFAYHTGYDVLYMLVADDLFTCAESDYFESSESDDPRYKLWLWDPETNFRTSIPLSHYGFDTIDKYISCSLHCSDTFIYLGLGNKIYVLD